MPLGSMGSVRVRKYYLIKSTFKSPLPPVEVVKKIPSGLWNLYLFSIGGCPHPPIGKQSAASFFPLRFPRNFSLRQLRFDECIRLPDIFLKFFIRQSPRLLYQHPFVPREIWRRNNSRHRR